MAFDAYIKIAGIEGESTDDHHPGWIEIIRFGVGVKQNIIAAPSSCGGACAGRADFRRLLIRAHQKLLGCGWSRFLIMH